MLGEVAKRHAFGFDDGASFFGRVFADYQLKQRGLPRAIRTDESDLLVMLNFPIQVTENGMGTENEGGI